MSFYQPVIALEMFNRTMHGLDVATGTETAVIGGGYRTVGPAMSEFREANATVQWVVLPADAVYDVDTEAPVGNGTG